MSTSEFDREWDDQCSDSPSLFAHEAELPEDFTAEDVAFAQQLNTLFAPELEEIPPYFVQTLLTVEDPQYMPANHGLEYKTQAHVFRRLKLRRRLFRRTKFSLVRLFRHIIKPQRSVVAVLTACMLFVVITMAATGPSFASGLNILLTGRHGGVLMVDTYPMLSSPARKPRNNNAIAAPMKISLRDTQQALPFLIHSPTELPGYYSLNEIDLYKGVDQSWADGPALLFEYTYGRQGQMAHGSGKISVVEFKPQGQVLQVVRDGAAHPIAVSKDGDTQAIYVDGQWVRINKFSHDDWLYGSRSEIIYEQDGIIFWIVGDQRDGIGETDLLNIAKSLQVYDTYSKFVADRADSVTVSYDNSNWPFAEDIVSTNTSSGSSMETISAGTPAQTISTTNTTPIAGHK